MWPSQSMNALEMEKKYNCVTARTRTSKTCVDVSVHAYLWICVCTQHSEKQYKLTKMFCLWLNSSKMSFATQLCRENEFYRIQSVYHF